MYLSTIDSVISILILNIEILTHNSKVNYIRKIIENIYFSKKEYI